MRVLIFHGYLLVGTGSNVYNAKLAEALAGLGHDVHLICQDRDPGRLPFVSAHGSWDSGRLEVDAVRPGGSGAAAEAGSAGVTVYRPDIGGLLPVYVADRYDGVQARPFADCTEAEISAYVDANVAAVSEVARRVAPDLALANHLIMGPAIVRRALAGSGIPYAVKVHGSALEYTVKPHPERFLPAAREGLEGAAAVLVGSRHTAESLWAAFREPDLPARTRLGPPGVDVAQFRPREEPGALHSELVGRLRGEAHATGGARDGGSFARDAGEAAAALARLDPGTDRIVAFTGKLIVSKGVDLLIAAWPLVTAVVPRAKLVVVGFGAYRSGLESLIGALADGDGARLREIAARGRELEGGPAGTPLRHLQAFLDSLSGAALDDYAREAARLPERVVLTGRLEHAELAELLPACEAQVVPSTFPEAFGMVAVEAAACGAFPVSAEHSGLAEVSGELARELGPPAERWLSFELGDGAVRAMAGCLVGWLTADSELRARTRRQLVEVVRRRHSWQRVAESVIAAAGGRLDELTAP